MNYNSLMILQIRNFFNTFLPFYVYVNPWWIYSKLKGNIWRNEKTYKTSSYESADDNVSQYFLKTIQVISNKHDSILDICCNQGRHLRALRSFGYRDLTGVDIMKPAVDLFYSRYGPLNPEINIECMDIKKYFEINVDKSFDFAIAMSASLELLDPMTNIFKNISCIVNKGAVFIINETGHSWPRFWDYGFMHNGFDICLKKNLHDSLTLFVIAKHEYSFQISSALKNNLTEKVL